MDNIENLVQMPEELLDAPDNVKQSYINWKKKEEESKNHEFRYYEFTNTLTQEIEHVDCRGIKGNLIIQAKKKNIDPSKIKELEQYIAACSLMKGEVSVAGVAWRKWLRPKIGKNVFEYRKSEILEMFGRYASNEDVKAKIESWGYEANMSYIHQFRLNNRDLIDKKRLSFLSTSRDYYVATEVGRIETLAMLHSKLLEQFTTLSQKIETPALREEMRSLSKAIQVILEQVRKETKGDEVKLTIDGKIDLNAATQAVNTIMEVCKKMPIHIIPVYMTAAKIGINPHNILTSLTNSFYKDFNGFSALNNEGKPPKTSDLIKSYDWGTITKENIELENNPLKVDSILEYNEINTIETEKVLSTRDILKNILNDKIKTVK